MVSRAIQLLPPKTVTETCDAAGSKTIAVGKGRIVSRDVISAGTNGTYKEWDSPTGGGTVLRDTADVDAAGTLKHPGDGFNTGLTVTLAGDPSPKIKYTVELD